MEKIGETLQNHRVPCVDDHADTVEIMTLMREARGFEVLSRSNIEDGLKAAAALCTKVGI